MQVLWPDWWHRIWASWERHKNTSQLAHTQAPFCMVGAYKCILLGSCSGGLYIFEKPLPERWWLFGQERKILAGFGRNSPEVCPRELRSWFQELLRVPTCSCSWSPQAGMITELRMWAFGRSFPGSSRSHNRSRWLRSPGPWNLHLQRNEPVTYLYCTSDWSVAKLRHQKTEKVACT